ncbi:MAG: NAD(P)H-hydrate epimerase, partial [Thermomicrobiales bacterium]
MHDTRDEGSSPGARQGDPAMSAPIPALPAAAMAEVDRLMLDELGVGTLQLMETAGHAIATFARETCMRGDVGGKRILALAGRGGNGGDA